MHIGDTGLQSNCLTLQDLWSSRSHLVSLITSQVSGHKDPTDVVDPIAGIGAVATSTFSSFFQSYWSSTRALNTIVKLLTSLNEVNLL